jgi:hypothetical protein
MRVKPTTLSEEQEDFEGFLRLLVLGVFLFGVMHGPLVRELHFTYISPCLGANIS